MELAFGIVFVLVAIAFIGFTVKTMLTKKEAPIAAAEQTLDTAFAERLPVEKAVATEVNVLKTDVVTEVHKIDGSILRMMHLAESDKTLTPGTTQAYVDAHTDVVKAAVSSIAPTETQKLETLSAGADEAGRLEVKAIIALHNAERHFEAPYGSAQKYVDNHMALLLAQRNPTNPTDA